MTETFRRARRLLGWALAVGACFGAVKSYGYHEKLSHGVTVATHEFFTFYYALTGIHFIHYVAGMVLLGVLASGPQKYGPVAENRAHYLR